MVRRLPEVIVQGEKRGVGFDVGLDDSTTGKSQIAMKILIYLVEHPEAQDTLEGIVEWWLLEQEIKHQTAKVKEALAELVAKGLIVEHTNRDSRAYYSMNPDKKEEIYSLIRSSE